MTAAYAGKPIVGVGMQPEQSSNLAAIERKAKEYTAKLEQ
ncbi:MAG: glycosyltransferase family 1 protein [Firmicutes bacterium]|nr:glycosyltransferase family 1 protein [Bacillota bacterium]